MSNGPFFPCENSYHFEGIQSYGDTIPGYAQGAYFPEDVPGIKCNLTGDYCCPDSCPNYSLLDDEQEE